MLHNIFSNLSENYWRFYGECKIFSCVNTSDGSDIISKLLMQFHNYKPMVLTDKGVSTTKFFSKLISNRYPIALLGKESDIVSLEEAINSATRYRANILIAVGGGSVIDGAKIIATSLGTGLKPHELPKIDVLPIPPVPLITIPTTFGTGSEVNMYSHITFPECKVSLRKHWLTPYAAISICDAAKELPADLRFLTAIDGWIHAFETLTLCRENSPIQKALAQEALRLFDSNIVEYIENPSVENLIAMSNVSILGGLCLNNSRTGLVHALATPFAKLTKLTHAESLLPFVVPVIKFNWEGISNIFQYKTLGTLINEINNKYLLYSDNIMSKWKFGIKNNDIEMLVEQCLLDTVLTHENPVNICRDDLINLYTCSLNQWILD